MSFIRLQNFIKPRHQFFIRILSVFGLLKNNPILQRVYFQLRAY